MSSNLTRALRELADSIDQLADLVETQRGLDQEEPVKMLGVIRQRFGQLTGPAAWSSEVLAERHIRGFLRRWLHTRQVVPARGDESLKGSGYLEDTARYLAQNFEHLDEFYKRLKTGQSRKRNFTYRGSRVALPYIKQWCKMLKSERLIDNVIEKSDEVFIDVAEVAQAVSFINGYWLEILLRAKVAKVLKENAAKVECYDVLSQVHVVKPDGTVTEIDLLLMINEQTYWFECKSGEIGTYYDLFKTHRRLLGLSERQSVAVVPEDNVDLIANFRQRSGMKCFGAGRLEEQLTHLIF